MNKVVLTSAYAPSIAKEEERPRKKQRPASSIDGVALLNDCGISAFQQQKYDEAEKCFSQALCRVDVRFLCASIKSSIDDFSKEATWKAVGSVSKNSYEEEKSTISCSGQERTKGSSDSASPMSETFLYIYQRHEYDEGMHVYDTPLTLKDAGFSDSVCSILSFNIAHTYVRRGQYAAALKWFHRALSGIEASETKPSFLPVQVLHNLGHCCYRLGQNAESIQHFEKALLLAGQGEVNQTAVAASLNCLGVLHFHRHADDADKAMKMLKVSLAIYRRQTLGKTREAATVLNNIGRIYYLWSKYEEALQIYGEALQTRKLLLGEKSIDVAATLYNTGQTYHQLGQLDEAMEYYEGYLDIAAARLGTESRDVAIVFRCMGEIHDERGNLKKALKMFKDALKSGRASMGNFHPEVASTLNKLGNLCFEMQHYDAALKYYKEGLEVEQTVLDRDHPHIIITLTNIAHIYKHRGDYSGALNAYRQVHKLQQKRFGDHSIEVAVTLSSIGLMQYHLKSLDAAFDSYQEALRLRRDFYGGDDHPDVASNLNSIGLVLFKQDMFELSKQCFTESLRIREKILGPNHRDVAILWYNIATIYFETGQDDVAIQLYKETLRVERVALGANHPDVVLTLQHIGQVLQQLGDLEGALQHFREALEIERRREADELSVAKILNLIGNIYLQQGKVDHMMKCFIDSSRIFEARQQPGETLVIAGYNFYGLSKIHPVSAAVA